jgi:hypothetical protein
MERVHLLPGFAILAREACSKLVAQGRRALGECNRKYLAEDLTILGMGPVGPRTFKELASIGCEIALDMTGLGPHRKGAQ